MFLPMGKNTPPPPPTLDPIDELPSNTNAEMFVLAAMFNPRSMPAVRELRPDDFTREAHKRVFRASLELAERGETINRLTVCEALKRHRWLQSVGVSYVSELADVPEIVDVGSYIRIVQDKSLRRRIIGAADGLAKRAISPTEDTDSLITSASEFFAGLQSENGQPKESPPSAPTWPDPIRDEGFYGIAGELVKVIEPHTEADRAALLLQFLVSWGSLIGRGAYYLAESDRHCTNEYTVIVGTTSKARKGTSWGRIGHVLGVIDAHWLEERLLPGLGSGEALIDAVSEEDRRTLVIESEFARLLAVVSRDGSTISASLRNGWDSGALAIRTRQKAVKVTGAHLSMIGHITREELLRRLDNTETANGFGNRILWCCARRSKLLSRGGGSMTIDSGLFNRLRKATDHARKMGNTPVDFDEAASKLWDQIYPELSEGKPGLLGSLTSRSEAHVVRLALIYALLDCADEIRVEHLRAALAVWRYCEDSARYIWGDSLGDPTADGILHALRAAGTDGLTRWDLMNHFSRHKKAEELDRAVGVLAERGLIRTATEDSGGRPVVRHWSL
jgi:hypothetical protein